MIFQTLTSGTQVSYAMNLRQGIGLLVVFTLYLLIGGAVFMVLEDDIPVPLNPTYEALLVFKNNLLSNTTTLINDADIWTRYVNSVFENISYPFNLSNETSTKWTFYDATFFCLTVVTTIGYGKKTPTTESSRGFCIVYALIGIPLTGIWMAGIGHYFSKKLLKAHEKTRTTRSSSPRLALVINTITYLIPGFVIFLLMPAAIFMAIEDWDYLDSFYYAVITLTTIGFGDLVAGQNNKNYNWAYRIGIMVWIIFGLGYLSMILNFIAKAMQSKHLKKFERTLTKNLKQTQDAFAKEVDYLIKSMNELIKGKHDVPSIKRRASLPSMEPSSPRPLRRSLSQGSLSVEPLGERTPAAESPANFVFDLAMAIACGDLTPESGARTPNEKTSNERPSNNVAQLLTMALLPQLKRGNSINVPGHTPLHGVKSAVPFFEFKNKKDGNPIKVAKSHSVVGDLLFPYGRSPSTGNAASTEDLGPRRKSEQSKSDNDGNLFRNIIKRQLERSESSPSSRFNYEAFAGRLNRKGSSKQSSLTVNLTDNKITPTTSSDKKNDEVFLSAATLEKHLTGKTNRRRLSSSRNPDNPVIITVTEEEDVQPNGS